MITSEQEAGNRSQVPWMSSRHGLSSVHWRVAFRLAGDGASDCRTVEAAGGSTRDFHDYRCQPRSLWGLARE
jgi:hypothetical protein